MSSCRDFIDPDTGEIRTDALMRAFDQLAEEAAELAAENEALTRSIKKSSRSEHAMSIQLQEKRKNDPRKHQIEEVLEYWLFALKKKKNTKIPLDGARAGKVRARLNDGFTVEELKEAIDGMAGRPFVGPRGRTAEKAPGCDRHDDLTIALQDESNVDRFRKYAKQDAAVKGPPKLELVQPESRTTRDAKTRAGLSTWPDTLGGGRERRAELTDTLRLIAVTLKQWERREREAA